MDTFHCVKCGERHAGPPLSYFSPAPVYWNQELAGRNDCELTVERCIIEQKHFFIKGNIHLPIQGTNTSFVWTVWVSLSKDNFERAVGSWDDPRRVDEPPYFGWLSTDLPYTPTTINLKTHVHTEPVGARPLIELEPTNHPLAVEQRDGITRQRVIEIAMQMAHHQ